MSNPKYCCEIEPDNVPDLVAVIRCKNCKLYETENCMMYYLDEATGHEGWPDEDGYCHMAEPK